MCFRVSIGGRDGVHDGLRRRLIRIPHAEVDEISPFLPSLGLELVKPRKDVFREIREPARRDQARFVLCVRRGQGTGFGGRSHGIDVGAAEFAVLHR